MSGTQAVTTLLIIIAVQTGVIFGLIAAIAASASGTPPAGVVGTGIGAFFVATTVTLGIMTFARG